MMEFAYNIHIFKFTAQNVNFRFIMIPPHCKTFTPVVRLMTSLPVYSQHLLVLLFGTFRVIAANSVVNETNMTAQALGVRYTSIAQNYF